MAAASPAGKVQQALLAWRSIDGNSEPIQRYLFLRRLQRCDQWFGNEMVGGPGGCGRTGSRAVGRKIEACWRSPGAAWWAAPSGGSTSAGGVGAGAARWCMGGPCAPCATHPVRVPQSVWHPHWAEKEVVGAQARPFSSRPARRGRQVP